MRKINMVMALLLVLAAGLTFMLGRQPHEWQGVDETVVGQYAAAAGHPARPPFINTNHGDLLLFFFLIAGLAGGFVAGYCFRELFPPNKD